MLSKNLKPLNNYINGKPTLTIRGRIYYFKNNKFYRLSTNKEAPPITQEFIKKSYIPSIVSREIVKSSLKKLKTLDDNDLKNHVKDFLVTIEIADESLRTFMSLEKIVEKIKLLIDFKKILKNPRKRVSINIRTKNVCTFEKYDHRDISNLVHGPKMFEQCF
jgi:hypothetical protein